MNETVRSEHAGTSKKKGSAKEPTRTNDPARTMANILEVAITEFSLKGLAGARIDEIAAETHTSKRMIYYYFGSKEGLYLAALEESYRRVRETESGLHLDDLTPVAALERLVEFTFDHHHGNENYVRLVMAENINHGQFLAQSQSIQALNVPAISAIERLYARGLADGIFRPGLDPIDIHASISALCFFNVSNRYTFGLIFKRDMGAPDVLAQRKRTIVDMVLRFVKA